ncbi:MAG: sensor N-terminal transmembrane domain-containing protein [Alphaproteobacteria bacterium]|nr:sensor N-terminal transmembrane domain-containing protein [Alphaproteobacteria bacterium]
MESDTATKKNKKIHRALWSGKKHPAELPEFGQIMDLYWGGPERRITGLTIRIIAVNALALLTLVFGILYLSEYQNDLVEARLETFQTEAEFISAALAEGALQEDGISVSLGNTERMIRRLSRTMNQDILLFDQNGALIADSRKIADENGNFYSAQPKARKETLYTVEILKDMAGAILKLLPDRRVFPEYPYNEKGEIANYPDIEEALQGHAVLSAWTGRDKRMLLSAAAPILKDGKLFGAVFLMRGAQDIENDIGRVWIDVLKMFGGTLVVTILLSIYLSGLIAKPLRRLMQAAESVRTGKRGDNEIPDMSYRHDEIGELSLVLRSMTQALHERMDSIESFAADVSHELKNPLTSLRSAVETLGVIKGKKDRDKLMGIIGHDISRLERLINDISSASRLDAELSRENFEKVDLWSLLGRIIDLYKDPLKRAQDNGLNDTPHSVTTLDDVSIRLAGECGGGLYVWGIESRLAQVFQNVLSNALSFSPKGGQIHVHVSAGKRRVFVKIEDEGPGIPEGKLQAIFERFYSERPAHEDYGMHSGLGLSICKQIVTALGGDMFAENIKGATGRSTGARFTIVLNLAAG